MVVFRVIIGFLIEKILKTACLNRMLLFTKRHLFTSKPWKMGSGLPAAACLRS
jgi:hypothetical protein